MSSNFCHQRSLHIYHQEDSVALRDLSSASPNLSAATSIMSILNLATKSNDRLKKLAQECISLDDVYDKCENCGCPVLLHPDRTKDCRRSVEETAEVVAKNWRDLKKRLKPLFKQIKEERQKEEEQIVFINGIK